jgi:hypothetical protein
LRSAISISHNAIFIKIADIIGKGRYLNASLNNIAEMRSVNIAVKNQAIL